MVADVISRCWVLGIFPTGCGSPRLLISVSGVARRRSSVFPIAAPILRARWVTGISASISRRVPQLDCCFLSSKNHTP